MRNNVLQVQLNGKQNDSCLIWELTVPQETSLFHKQRRTREIMYLVVSWISVSASRRAVNCISWTSSRINLKASVSGGSPVSVLKKWTFFEMNRWENIIFGFLSRTESFLINAAFLSLSSSKRNSSNSLVTCASWITSPANMTSTSVLLMLNPLWIKATTSHSVIWALQENTKSVKFAFRSSAVWRTLQPRDKIEVVANSAFP